jgi:hypothetical protein
MLLLDVGEEAGGFNHHFQPHDQGRSRMTFIWDKVRSDLPLSNTALCVPLKVLIATCPTRGGSDGAEGWPRVCGVFVDQTRTALSYNRITPLSMSDRLRADPAVECGFEIGTVEGCSNIPCFPASEELFLQRFNGHGLIHEILTSSYFRYKRLLDELDKSARATPAGMLVYQGERALRTLLHSNEVSIGIVVNPFNFVSIKEYEWPGHVAAFYRLSPLSKKVTKVAVMQLVDRHSNSLSFLWLNQLPRSPTVSSFLYSPEPVGFGRGDLTSGSLVYRSETVSKVCLVVHATPIKNREEVEVGELITSVEDSMDEGGGLLSA